MYRTKIERIIEGALREKAVDISNTAPMQADFGTKEGRVKSFLRRVGAKLQRVKAHVRKHKGKYLLAGAVGLAGAAMLHKAAKVESPKYAELVKKYTGGFTNAAAEVASRMHERLKPHIASYAKDYRWLKHKTKPVIRTAAKYPRISMLLGALAAERAHRFAYRNADAYKNLSDAVDKKVKAFVADSPILSNAVNEFQDRFGRRLGAKAASAVGAQVDDAIFDAANYGYRVARGTENPIKGLGGSPAKRAVRAKETKKKTKRKQKGGGRR